MELSRDINSAFKQHVSHLTENDGSLLASDRIDLTVSVLSMAFWPTYPVMNILIPPYMMKYQDIFYKFYQVQSHLLFGCNVKPIRSIISVKLLQGKYSGRKLQWQASLGHCVLRAHFKSGQKELQVSLFQGEILK